MERAASQEHFIDICRMLDLQTPNEADPTGDWYAFEKGAEKLDGRDGFADVWKRKHFAWEYKGKKKNLGVAYKQLLDYREALENPPLLVVCDLDRFQVHTNFTGTLKKVYEFDLADMKKDAQEPLRILRAALTDPDSLKPESTPEQLTEAAAGDFAKLAQRLRDRGEDPHAVAHFLSKLVFCLFSEDSGLLPNGLLERLSEGTRLRHEAFAEGLRKLFAVMTDRGGMFGAEEIGWFNGGLFDSDEALLMETVEIDMLRLVGQLDWSQIEPAIFGTLFERGLDPGKRSQLGAHYTDRNSIERIVEPVVIAPLRREFQAMKGRVEPLLEKRKNEMATKVLMEGKVRRATTRARRKMEPGEKEFRAFLGRLRSIQVLDPACGSGNFLYVALKSLKDLEREVIEWGSLELGLTEFPEIGPQNVWGIELNAYAAELARVTIWIGHLQWMIGNGFGYDREPVLKPLHNIEARDALLRYSDGEVDEAEWPEADLIIGNPPFLGGKLMRRGLSDEYVDQLFEVFDARVPREADFVTYWFEKARAEIEGGRARRAGLLATQGIRGGANRRVLERVKDSGDIFMAWSDEPWVVEGATVHVSIVGFDDGSELRRQLDGKEVDRINANLTWGVDVTGAARLRENRHIAFMGDTKGGPFDISEGVAKELLIAPNPDGRSNRDVVKPSFNSKDIVQRPRDKWIVDFPPGMSMKEAALYEAPFEYVKEHVKPEREKNKREGYAKRWWLHAEPRPGMRVALEGLKRYIATPTTSKHRLFVWLDGPVLPDHALIVFARDDDLTFGILHSRVHELWARSKGTQLREYESGFRYTPSTTFETFPFPELTKGSAAQISEIAAELHQRRKDWMNPPDLGPAQLAKRTLTALYNDSPTWLQQIHERLDVAVIEAYGWPADVDDEEILERLLELNQKRDSSGEKPRLLG